MFWNLNQLHSNIFLVHVCHFCGIYNEIHFKHFNSGNLRGKRSYSYIGNSDQSKIILSPESLLRGWEALT